MYRSYMTHDVILCKLKLLNKVIKSAYIYRCRGRGYASILKKKHIFDGDDIALQESIRFFKVEFSLIMHRAKSSLKEGM
jgi:hypothetical protein